MFNTNDMYNLYRKGIKEDIIKYNNKAIDIQNSITTSLNMLNQFRDWIEHYTNINIDTLIEQPILRGAELKEYIDNIIPRLESNDPRNVGYLSLLKGNILNINNRRYLNNIVVNKLKELNKPRIGSNIYKSVINKYNTSAVWDIINGKKDFTFGSSTGRIRVKYKKCYCKEGTIYNNKQIDHNSTRILKNKLIAEGIKIFEVTRDDKGNIIGNNGGKRYLVYYNNDLRPYIVWSKLTVFVSNKQLYIFEPTKQVPTTRINGELLTLSKIEELVISGKLKYDDINKLQLGFRRKLVLASKTNSNYKTIFADDI